MPKRKGDVTYDDNPACVEMHSLIQAGDARSPNQASYLVADLEWVGGNSAESTARRLRGKYSDWLAVREEAKEKAQNEVGARQSRATRVPQSRELRVDTETSDFYSCIPDGLEQFAGPLDDLRGQAFGYGDADPFAIPMLESYRQVICRKKLEVMASTDAIVAFRLELMVYDSEVSREEFERAFAIREQMKALESWEHLVDEMEIALKEKERIRRQGVMRLLSL